MRIMENTDKHELNYSIPPSNPLEGLRQAVKELNDYIDNNKFPSKDIIQDHKINIAHQAIAAFAPPDFWLRHNIKEQ